MASLEPGQDAGPVQKVVNQLYRYSTLRPGRRVIGENCCRPIGVYAWPALRNATRSHIRRTRQSMLAQGVASSIRLPLQTSRPLWLQYRQIACWTNRGKVWGNDELNCRASIRRATA
jgi:hypothetical protein